jgi:electron transport complex protein RnfG
LFNSIIKPSLVLLLVAFAASFSLSHIQKITYPNIIKMEKEKQDLALKLVLPGYRITGSKKAKVEGKEFEYWTAEKEEGGTAGYAFMVAGNGYSGPVESIVGIDDRGTILGMSILKQSETPGLGARCVEVSSKETLFDKLLEKTARNEIYMPWFQKQFSGLNSGEKIRILKKGEWNEGLMESLRKENAVLAITGATVTSVTVTESIKNGHELLKKALASGAEKKEAGK